MTNSIYSIGLSGLAAAQAGLLTTSHNITNVNTPGFSRQEIIQGARLPQFSGAGYLGQGVNVTTVRRIYSSFLTAQTQSAQAQASHLDAYSTQLSGLDNIFADPTTGLAPALADLWSGVNSLAAHPGDTPTRQAMLTSATALTNRFHQLDDQLEGMRDNVNTQISETVTQINGYIGQIATVNQQIAEANAAGDGTVAPNDLLDKRDALITELNKLVGAHAVAQSDGTYNVFLSNGQALVVGAQGSTLTATPDPTDPTSIQVGLKTGPSVLQFSSADLTGGSLGGILAYRDNALTSAQNQLGRIALVLAQTFNTQHKLGQDLNGAQGGDFFATPQPVIKNASTNTGTAAIAVAVTTPTAVQASDYRLQWDGSNYTLTRLSDNTQQVFATLPQTVDGLDITLGGGAPAAGDSFLIQPTRYGARDIGVAITDPNKIAAAVPVVTGQSSSNVGNAAIALVSASAAYWATPLAAPITLSYSTTTGMLTGFPPAQPVSVTVAGVTTVYPAGAPVPYTSGATIAFGGITFTISGTIANGDTFTIGPNTTGAGDNRNARALANLADATTVGGTTYSGAYGQLTAYVGTTAQEANVESDAQATLLTQAQQSEQAVSGVNLDEEAANLEKYQQAYQAAGKVLSIAGTLFDTILNLSTTTTTG